MAVGGTQERVVLENGEPVVQHAVSVTLSADHRVYDGEIASAFLKAFCANLANPVRLLV